MLVVMSLNCVVNLCSSVDFVIGFPVGLWIHLEKKNADYADAAFGCATRRCRSQARDLLSQPLGRCLKD